MSKPGHRCVAPGNKVEFLALIARGLDHGHKSLLEEILVVKDPTKLYFYYLGLLGSPFKFLYTSFTIQNYSPAGETS